MAILTWKAFVQQKVPRGICLNPNRLYMVVKPGYQKVTFGLSKNIKVIFLETGVIYANIYHLKFAILV